MGTTKEYRIRELERQQSRRAGRLKSLEAGVARAMTGAILLRNYTENWDGPGGSGPPCSGVVTLTFTCGATPQSGVSVTITNGTTSFSGTTNGSGQVSFTPGVAGTWTGTASKSGFVTRSFSFGYTCETAAFTFGFGSASTLVSGTVIYCGAARAGILIEALDSTGLVIGSAVTDSSGNYSFGFSSQLGTTITFRASGTYVTTQTTTRTVNCGSSISGLNFAMSLQSGKRCVCTGQIADANTLNFSSSGYSATLNYGTSPVSGGGVYYGFVVVSCKAVTGSSCAKSVAPVTLTVEFNPSTCTLIAYFKNETVAGGASFCPSAGGITRLPASDARCAALPEPPLFSTNCSIDGSNGGGVSVSVSGPPVGSPPFIATFTGTLFCDADGAPFLVNAVVSE